MRERRENVWDALALVVRAGAHGVFGELEGVELALKMMPARAAARTLDYASATSEAVCCKIVDAVRAPRVARAHARGGAGRARCVVRGAQGEGGKKAPSRWRRRRRGRAPWCVRAGERFLTQTVLAVLASLVLQLREGGVQRERVMRKLAEDGKTERLVDIRRGAPFYLLRCGCARAD